MAIDPRMEFLQRFTGTSVAHVPEYNEGVTMSEDNNLSTIDIDEILREIEEHRTISSFVEDDKYILEDINPKYLPVAYTTKKKSLETSPEEKLFRIFQKLEFPLYDEKSVINHLNDECSRQNEHLTTILKPSYFENLPEDKKRVVVWCWRPLHAVSSKFKLNLNAPKFKDKFSEKFNIQPLEGEQVIRTRLPVSGSLDMTVGFFDNSSYPLAIPIEKVRRIAELGTELDRNGVKHLIVVGGPIGINLYLNRYDSVQPESNYSDKVSIRLDPFAGVILQGSKRVYTFEHWDEPGFKLVNPDK